MRRIRPTLGVVVFALLLGGIRWLFPERPVTYTGPRALLDAAFAIGLLGLVLLVAGGLGLKVLRWLKLQDLTPLEQAVFGLPMGMGILAYGVLALGLLGWLRPWAILLWLVLAGVWAWREWNQLASRLPRWVARQLQATKDLGWAEKTVLILGGLILVFSFLQALPPPWDYDGLMYHLQGPRLFLQAGRISLLPDVWQANGPFTLEMLFAVGLSWESDTFAKLLQLACAGLLFLATFAFGRRYLGRAGAWIAASLLLGVPTLPFWASTAYTDMAWAMYEFLGLYALILWQQRRQHRWLTLAGLMVGWALGSKYLALGGVGVLGLWTLWQSRRAGPQSILVRAASFGATALLVASPWYLKNWLLSGNPVFPFLFGGACWDAERLELLMAYLGSFGTGRGFLDYLLLPWNLYAQHEEFGTLWKEIDFPSLLLPLAILSPFIRRDRVMNSVTCLAGLRFVVWALGSQQTRFLLPIFPALALMGASVLTYLMRHLEARFARGWARLVLLPAGVMMLVTLLIQVMWFATIPPTRVIWGQESKDAFLRKWVDEYPALQFAHHNLPADERILLVWNGQGYYCYPLCVANTDQATWTRLVDPKLDPAEVARKLLATGVTHLLFTHRDTLWLLDHDPTGQHQRAMEHFEHQFLPSCAEEIYRDRQAFLVRITCRDKGSQTGPSVP